MGKLLRFKKKTWGLLTELVICTLVFLFGIFMLVFGIQARLSTSISSHEHSRPLDFLSLLSSDPRGPACRRSWERSLTSTRAALCSMTSHR
jgi:hypothetical protein